MQTIRGQLATWYALAMLGTLAVFVTTFYLVDRDWSRRRIDERLQLEADMIAAILVEASRTQDSTSAPEIPSNPQTDIVDVTSDSGVVGSQILSPWVAYGVRSDAAVIMAGVLDFVLLLGPQEPVLWNDRVQAEHTNESLRDFAAAARRTFDAGEQFGVASIRRALGGDIRYCVRPLATSGVVAVVTGVPVSELRAHLNRLLSLTTSVALFVVAALTWVAYLLAGRALKPVDLIVDEVEAITDGRSLHRRLATPKTQDEFRRLNTTLNAMLWRLETSFFALRRFTADASHELKTPLTVLRAGIERAVTHPKTSDEVLEVLEETLVEVNRMTELVDSLLLLARTDEGRARIVLEDTDLRDILSEVAETASILEENSSVSVTVLVPEKALILPLDRGRIRQLMMNLLTNAIKFNKPGGRVSVDSKQENDQVVIRVSDTGVGMSGSELEHIFERFWRADPARSRTGPRSGAGLGMAISKWIVEVHGGTIEAESSPKRGTTVTVRLPLEVSP